MKMNQSINHGNQISLWDPHDLRFSQQYLQLLAQEVEESLEQSGSMSVADLASNLAIRDIHSAC